MDSDNSARAPIRVRSVPAGHDYVRHAIGAPSASGGPVGGSAAAADGVPVVEVLDDPVLDPDDPARWWPHPALEAAERPEVLDGTDVVHVHFGYEHRTPGQIAQFVSAVRGRGLPLVVTVHDLTNPHESDPAAHLQRTGHLVRGADVVITLTHGAAEEIRALWGVDPQVIPHPRLMPSQVTEPHRRLRQDRRQHQRQSRHARPRPGDSPATVGVVLGSLRAGVAAEELLPALVETLSALPAATELVVMVRSDALAAARDPRHPRHAAAVVADRLVGAPGVEVRAHDHLDDDELCTALAGFDALVLPHRHGTHSGWLELCRDLGVPPVIPQIGHLAEQWGPDANLYNPAQPDGGSLRSALIAALDGPTPPPRRPDAEDSTVSAAHAELYRAALTSPRYGSRFL